MMSPLKISLVTMLALSGVTLGQLSVGQNSDDVSFTAFNSGNDLENTQLGDFAGKVVVMYYYTPW